MTDSNSYTTTVLVERSPEEAFDAINNVRGWWSQEVEGVTTEVGGEFEYHYEEVHRCRMRVTELVPGSKVAWHVLENRFDFTQDQIEWKDTDIVFDISKTADGTQIRFTHVGLVPQHECYDVCANAWGGYITSSLRDLIDTGTGQPNPKDVANLPEHQETATTHRVQR